LETLSETQEAHYTIFEGFNAVGRGTHSEVRQAVRALKAERETATFLVFNDETGESLDQDFERVETAHLLQARVTEAAPRKVGRPRLGVVAREITLLPRHWEWLEAQQGGASVALRKLVEIARKQQEPEDRIRHAISVTFKFLNVMGGRMPGFEDVNRALFQRDWARFDALVAAYPRDVAGYLAMLSKPARLESGESAG
jgi:hypothetical protein